MPFRLGHRMGPVRRPTGGWSHGLRHGDTLVAVTATDVLMQPRVAGLGRHEAVELFALVHWSNEFDQSSGVGPCQPLPTRSEMSEMGWEADRQVLGGYAVKAAARLITELPQQCAVIPGAWQVGVSLNQPFARMAAEIVRSGRIWGFPVRPLRGCE